MSDDLYSRGVVPESVAFSGNSPSDYAESWIRRSVNVESPLILTSAAKENPMAKCPYCENGKVKISESDPTGRKTYIIDQTCGKCGGDGVMDCKDAAGQDVTVGDEVTITLRVANLHKRRDGKGCNVELHRVLDGEATENFLACDSTLVEKK